MCLATVIDLAPSVRSWSLGLTGTADASDPANAFFNPAVVPWTQGAYAMSGYGRLYTFLGDDTYTYNAGVGCGLRGGSPGPTRLAFGAAVLYSALHWAEYEARDENNNYLGVFRPKERSLGVTAGLGATFRDAYHGSIGFSLKPWWYDDDHAKDSEVSCDIGIMLGADFLVSGDLKVSPSVGLGFLNVNSGDVFFENNRYGLGVRLEAKTSSFIKERFGVEVPSAAITALYDNVEDRSGAELDKHDSHGFGAEFSVARIIFMRAGTYSYSGRMGKGYRYTNYGLGLGLTVKRGWGRFDYASVSQGSFDERAQKFGLSFGLTF